MTKSTVSFRLGETELIALDKLKAGTRLTRSEILETIVSQFLDQDDDAQRARFKPAPGIRKDQHPKGYHPPKRWGV